MPTASNRESSIHAVPRTLRRDDILDKCLQAIEKQQATIESCVKEYPEFPELASLLRAAAAVQQVQPVAMPQMSKNEVRQRMMAHYRAKKTRPTFQSRIQQSRWVRPLAAAFVLIFLFSFSGAGLVRASAATLPGDNLYPVKRFAEQMQLALSSGIARLEMLETIAETRLSEIALLAENHRTITLSILGDTSTAVEIALKEQPDVAARQRLTANALQVIEQVQKSGAIDGSTAVVVMATIQDNQPPTPTLATNNGGGDNNGNGNGGGNGGNGKDPTETATNTLTYTPTNTPTNTYTATNTPSYTPSATLTSTATETATATNTASQTPSYTPSATLSQTPKPTKTPKATSTKVKPTKTPKATSTKVKPSKTPAATKRPVIQPTKIKPNNAGGNTNNNAGGNPNNNAGGNGNGGGNPNPPPDNGGGNGGDNGGGNPNPPPDNGGGNGGDNGGGNGGGKK
jgi:hypothetical protein